jgi:pimeloyl-ACP methyl ester carboxylesterase
MNGRVTSGPGQSVTEPPRGDGGALRTARTDDGREVAYAEYGDSSGVPVVFQHGTPGSRLLGQVLAAPARERGIRLLAPDRPGYGRSPPPASAGSRTAGRVVDAVLEAAEVSDAHLVGFSGGGQPSLAAAASRPEAVRSVDVLAGAVPPGLRDGVPAAVRLSGRAPRLLGGLLRVQARIAARGPPSLVSGQYVAAAAPEPPEPLAETVRRDFVEAFAERATGFTTETRLLAEGWTVPQQPKGTPVRLWYGEADTNVPAAAGRRLAERVPGADLTVVPEADHLRTLCRGGAAALERIDGMN